MLRHLYYWRASVGLILLACFGRESYGWDGAQAASTRSGCETRSAGIRCRHHQLPDNLLWLRNRLDRKELSHRAAAPDERTACESVARFYKKRGSSVGSPVSLPTIRQLPVRSARGRSARRVP